nr:hydantoinase/oxoprolinase family protein [Methylocapsa palsarum]
MQTVIGWDIGGAHLKAARADDGVVTAAAQIASPLWLGLEELDRAFAAAQAEIGAASVHAITMTGELCDAFATRDEGVAGLAEIANRRLSPARVFFYAGRAGFVEWAGVGAQAREIASANWHASAALTGLRAPEALFIDMGSTTTDLIPVSGGVPAARGASDAQRLAHGELVYTGLVRTFLMAGPKLVPFEGALTPLMNEWFASAADVYRILGRLPEEADLMETPDGREKTVSASRARLARMIGRDAGEADDDAWERLARYFAEAQMREIMDAAALVLSRGLIGPCAPIVGAGCGRDIVRGMAARMERPYLAFDDLIEAAPGARGKASDCAGACAMALIGARRLPL